MAGKKRKSRGRRKPSLPKFNGDHGTGTTAATQGTVVEPVEDEKGSNPNNMGRRRRLSAIDGMTLTMRQEQAAKAIEAAWCRLQALSSGGPLKEQVDNSSPKPDAVIAAQVAAQSKWHDVTASILRSERNIVFWVCCENRPIGQLARVHGEKRVSERFKTAMDRVADHMGY